MLIQGSVPKKQSAGKAGEPTENLLPGQFDLTTHWPKQSQAILGL